MSAFAVPSTLDTISEFTLNTLPLEAALLMMDVAAVVVRSATAVLPVMVATLTILGAAMNFSFKN
jgi:hexokinase